MICALSSDLRAVPIPLSRYRAERQSSAIIGGLVQRDHYSLGGPLALLTGSRCRLVPRFGSTTAGSPPGDGSLRLPDQRHRGPETVSPTCRRVWLLCHLGSLWQRTSRCRPQQFNTHCSLPAEAKTGAGVLITPLAASRVQAPRRYIRSPRSGPRLCGPRLVVSGGLGNADGPPESASNMQPRYRIFLIRHKRGERLRFGGSDKFAAAEI